MPIGNNNYPMGGNVNLNNQTFGNQNPNPGQSQNNQNQGVTNPGFRGFNSYIPGGYVNSAAEIPDRAIPNDGTLCLFPQSDYGAIHARQWTPQGLVSVTYTPQQQMEPKNGGTTDLSEVYSRMERMEEKMDKFLSKLNRRYYTKSKTQKEDE